jgi:hypothetical protein
MSLRRKLLWTWCGFTIMWWLWGLVSDGSLVLQKFQVGGCRSAYVHFAVTLVIALVVPLTVLLIGLRHDAVRLNCARPHSLPLVPAKAGTQHWIPASAGMSGEWDDSI